MEIFASFAASIRARPARKRAAFSATASKPIGKRSGPNASKFGPDLFPIGLDAVAENAARFRAGLALMEAAKDAKISMFGHSAFRMPHFSRGGGLSPVGTLWKI